ATDHLIPVYSYPGCNLIIFLRLPTLTRCVPNVNPRAVSDTAGSGSEVVFGVSSGDDTTTDITIHPSTSAGIAKSSDATRNISLNCAPLGRVPAASCRTTQRIKLAETASKWAVGSSSTTNHARSLELTAAAAMSRAKTRAKPRRRRSPGERSSIERDWAP